MRAIMFDTSPKTASLHHVIKALKNPNFANRLKDEFCAPATADVIGQDDDPEMRKFIEKSIQEHERKSKEHQFEELLPATINKYDALVSSDITDRVNNSRCKMISHKEINNSDSERALYNPPDFGLKWSDAKEIIGLSKDIIFKCNYLINMSHYDLEGFTGAHKEAALCFWSNITNKAKTPD